MSDTGFDLTQYKKTLRPDRQRSYMLIAKAIAKWLKPESVVDYGCGPGWILHNLHESHGVDDVYGFEYADEEALKVAPTTMKDRIEYMDLTGIPAIHYSDPFGLAISIEVAEHLPEEKADAYLKNITMFTSLLLFSAAPPGQGGVGHINEQPWGYWLEKFANLGWEEDEERGLQIRSYLRKKGAKSWYCKNIRVMEEV